MFDEKNISVVSFFILNQSSVLNLIRLLYMFSITYPSESFSFCCNKINSFKVVIKYLGLLKLNCLATVSVSCWVNRLPVMFSCIPIRVYFSSLYLTTIKLFGEVYSNANVILLFVIYSLISFLLSKLLKYTNAFSLYYVFVEEVVETIKLSL